MIPIDTSKSISRATRFVARTDAQKGKGPMSLYVPGLLVETEARPQSRYRNVRVSQTAALRSPDTSKIPLSADRTASTKRPAPRKKPVDAVDERIKAEVLENYSLPTNLFKRMMQAPKEEQAQVHKETAAQQPKSPRVPTSVKVVQPGIDYEHEISDFLQRNAYRISD